MPLHQQLKFDLQPSNQRVEIIIERSKYPDSKSQYEFYTVATASKLTPQALITRCKHAQPSYRWRLVVKHYQTFTQEILAKVEYLK